MSRALPGEQKGPQALPTLMVASALRVGCVQLRRWVRSPQIGALWWLNYSVNLHREIHAVKVQHFFFLQFLFCRSE